MFRYGRYFRRAPLMPCRFSFSRRPDYFRRYARALRCMLRCHADAELRRFAYAPCHFLYLRRATDAAALPIAGAFRFFFRAARGALRSAMPRRAARMRADMMRCKDTRYVIRENV